MTELTDLNQLTQLKNIIFEVNISEVILTELIELTHLKHSCQFSQFIDSVNRRKFIIFDGKLTLLTLDKACVQFVQYCQMIR